jgi:hypothetical protein
MIHFVHVQCPYCWQAVQLSIDTSVREQEYTEDCEVCCRPMVLRVTIDRHGIPQVEARGENE